MENISRKEFKQHCLELLTNELVKNGYEPIVLPKKGNNSREISITRKSDSKKITIQLKTKSDSNPAYPMHSRAEKLASPDYFYALANLDKDNKILFRIVPSAAISKSIDADHSKWLETPGLYGKQHNDNTLRKFYDYEEKYLNAWNLLEQ